MSLLEVLSLFCGSALFYYLVRSDLRQKLAPPIFGEETVEAVCPPEVYFSANQDTQEDSALDMTMALLEDDLTEVETVGPERPELCDLRQKLDRKRPAAQVILGKNALQRPLPPRDASKRPALLERTTMQVGPLKVDIEAA